MAIQTDLTHFGEELRRWRKHRRFSQLEVSSRAEVSQRHLSFLETGRSKPSPEMVEHLSIVLDLPLRARNSLLNAAGFAPAYSEESLHGPGLAQVKESLEALVNAHEPFPAYVLDRSWNLVLANEAAVRMTTMLITRAIEPEVAMNVVRLFLHPDGARHSVVNWEEVAQVLVSRLYAECGYYSGDRVLEALYDEVMAYDGVAGLGSSTVHPSAARFLTEMHVRNGGDEFRFYTAISSLGSPADVTLEELRLETLLPADEQTASTLRDRTGVR